MKRLLVLCLFCVGALWSGCYEELIEVFDKYGGDRYMAGEAVTQKNHVLQAAYLAEKAGAPEEIIIALLFHDIGRVIEDDLIGNEPALHELHDDLGANWLQERNFPKVVSDLLRYHTLAKIFLCQEESDYYDHLSLPSQDSYHIQKEKYSKKPDAIDRFNALPYRSWILTARKCDDMAKDAYLDWSVGDIPDFDHYREMIERVRCGEGKPAQLEDWQQTIDIWHLKTIRDFGV